MTALPPTAEQWLQSLADESGGKMEAAAMLLGFSNHASVHFLLKRIGLKWPGCRNFEYRGEIGSMRHHCKRFGLSHNAAKCYRQRSGLSGAAVLDKYLAGEIVRYRFGAKK